MFQGLSTDQKKERQQCLELSRLLRNQMIFWEILDSGFLCLQNSYFECACELYPSCSQGGRRKLHHSKERFA